MPSIPARTRNINPDSAPVQLAVPLISNIQKTVAAGLRWDAFSSVDFKFQVERVNTDGTPGISFSNPDLAGALRFDVPVTHPVTVVQRQCRLRILRSE